MLRRTTTCYSRETGLSPLLQAQEPGEDPRPIARSCDPYLGIIPKALSIATAIPMRLSPPMKPELTGSRQPQPALPACGAGTRRWPSRGRSCWNWSPE